jgi:protein-disulfide isomerase
MKTRLGSQTDLASDGRRAIRKRILLVFAGLGILVVAALMFLPRLNSRPAAAPTNSIPSTGMNPAPMDAAPSLGPETAPVTVIEYADFGCLSCWYWYKIGVLDQLRTNYGKQIRFVWRDYPVITLLSPKAAEAGQCANEQGKFWEFHDAVYDHQGVIGAQDLIAYAGEIGLNMSQFKDCVASRRYRDRVNAEQSEAFRHGFNGAPFFLVNNQVLIGPQPFTVFAGWIDPILISGK